MHHFNCPFDNPHDAENTARMGDKAKPSSVGAPTALLFVESRSFFIEMVTLAGLEPATSPAPVNKDALSPLSYSVVTIFTTVCGSAEA